MILKRRWKNWNPFSLRLGASSLEAFDLETEEMLTRLYGVDHRYVETYKYATLGEAEALVNLPESAQEPMAKDRPKMGLQQRRQALLAMLIEMQDDEAQEAVALTGEDHEDPPSIFKEVCSPCGERNE